MDNFLDIAIIGVGVNTYISNKITNQINTRKLKITLTWNLLISSFFLSNVTFLLFINFFKWYYLLLFLFLFILISIYLHLVFKSAIFLICYYGINCLLVYFSPYLSFKEGLVLVTYPLGIYYYLLIPCFSLSILYLLLTLKRRFKKVCYEYDIELFVEDIKIKLKGYLDSGNTLLINNYPVIFLANKYNYLLKSQGEKYNVNIATINNEEKLDNSIKGRIIIKVKKKHISYDVLISISNKREHFHDYDCLLNLNLIV